MNREVLKKQLRERFEHALNRMIGAVEQAPDGRWIAASEWEVRQAGQDLTRDCYQAILQARVEQTPAATEPSFSPSTGPSTGDVPAQQGKPKGPSAHGGR
jgi:hypothetical protein